MYHIDLKNCLTTLPDNEEFINGLLLSIITYHARLCQIVARGSRLTPWMLLNASDTGELRWFLTIGCSIDQMEDVRNFFLTYGTQQPELLDDEGHSPDAIFGTLIYVPDNQTHLLHYSIAKPQLPFSATIYFTGCSRLEYSEIHDLVIELFSRCTY